MPSYELNEGPSYPIGRGNLSGHKLVTEDHAPDCWRYLILLKDGSAPSPKMSWVNPPHTMALGEGWFPREAPSCPRLKEALHTHKGGKRPHTHRVKFLIPPKHRGSPLTLGELGVSQFQTEVLSRLRWMGAPHTQEGR